jgi:hypothetical protein
VDALEAQLHARHRADQAETGHHGAEGVRVALAREREALPRGGEQVELEHVVAERPDLEAVLAVQVHGHRTGERREHGSGHHRRPPSLRQRRAPDVGDARAALGLDHTARGVERQHAAHRAAIHRELPAVQRGIAVGAPGAAEGDLQALGTRGGEHRGEFLHARG